MAIFGVGTDIIQIERVKRSFVNHGDKFVSRILADVEIKQLQQKKSEASKVAFLAKRFAAKEAISKALGTGMRQGVDFKQLVIVADELGKPIVALHEKAKEWANQNAITKIHVSISDEKDAAVAFAVAETT